MTTQLRLADGDSRPMAVDDWCAAATSEEISLLRTLNGPVLDLGCGPGRLVVALNELGTPALGIDASPHALAHATLRGASTLRHSVFDRLPGEGRWATVLLFDGNIGIGGDPVALLQRAARLLAPDGHVVVEVECSAGRWRSTHARLEHDDATTVWFPWAFVTVESIDDIAATAQLTRVHAAWIDNRCFVFLAKRTPR